MVRKSLDIREELGGDTYENELNVKIKLAKYLEPLLDFPSADKRHWWFVLILDPRYVNELTYVRKLHEIENVDTRTIINEIMPKFYDYIVSEELAENPYTALTVVTTINISLFFNEETVGEPGTSSRGGNILRKRFDSEFKVFFNVVSAQTAIKNEDFLTW